MNQRASRPWYSRWQITPKKIRTQLLLSVNLVLLVLLVVLVGYDYQREMSIRFHQRRSALQEEAESLFQACRVSSRQGIVATQHFIDDVCAAAHDNQSPGHHIIVEISGSVLQARSHGRQSAEMLSRIRDASHAHPDTAASLADIVVGTFGDQDIRIYVAESVSDIRRAIKSETLKRSGTLLILALVAAIVVNLAIGHFVTRPLLRLVTVLKRIGHGELGLQSRLFDSEELNYLADEINRMSLNLAEADRDRRVQMAKARSIQKELLPVGIRIPNVEYSCLFEPADEIGGDYYDIIQLPDESWLFCLADVSGHGVPAAMTAAIIKSMLFEAASRYSRPTQILDHINRGLLNISPDGNFVTMALARYDSELQSLEFVSAGHETGFLRLANGCIEELNSTGLIIGVSPEAEWACREFELSGSVCLVLTTDGVTETFGPDQTLFGRDRVRDLLQRSTEESNSVDQFVQRLANAVTEYRNGERQQDDVTVLAVQFGLNPSLAMN
ncbi:MAG: SpoIIE family protein phosphatase [Planctomycetaceae bacterium]|nr:SpoIIE family protein phosphatase [Planctomycetaceae bacterium]